MARGVNKVILIGNIVKDPEVRATAGGDCIVNFTLATSESWKDKKTGNKEERSEFHRLCAFNRLAEIVRDYVVKGSKVYVEGSLRTRKWQNSEGKDQYTTEIVASEMQMLDGKPESSQSGYARMDGKPDIQAPQFDDGLDIPF
jgi:single-strand DNA-binding protein